VKRRADWPTRPAEDGDRHFIVSMWTQSYRDANTAGLIQVEDWFRVMDPTIAKVLARPDVQSIVAYHPKAQRGVADLAGFITFDAEERPTLVYYLAVKEPYRRMGVATALFRAAGVDPRAAFNYVCSTWWVRKLERKVPLARWRPLWGRFPKHERREGRPESETR